MASMGILLVARATMHPTAFFSPAAASAVIFRFAILVRTVTSGHPFRIRATTKNTTRKASTSTRTTSTRTTTTTFATMGFLFVQFKDLPTIEQSEGVQFFNS